MLVSQFRIVSYGKLFFNHELFVLQGCIRRLQQVNAVRVQVPQPAKGWYFTSTDLPVCRSAGECFIDPQSISALMVIHHILELKVDQLFQQSLPSATASGA